MFIKVFEHTVNLMRIAFVSPIKDGQFTIKFSGDTYILVKHDDAEVLNTAKEALDECLLSLALDYNEYDEDDE